MKLAPASFQKLLLAWFDLHGRKSLPWQINKTPYRVWVSEIMLQQTQVTTVIAYFERFMQRFPDLTSLAKTSEDEILHYWAGLGYYSRARHLLRAAKIIIKDYSGQFPDNLHELQNLPGIGRSTAGAILSIAFNRPAAILDGNVKRVLARLHGISDPINEKKTEENLWKLAIKYTPQERVGDYTQAMMDLGATLCTRSKPGCERCPFRKNCTAYKKEIVALLPAKKSSRKIPTHSATFLVLKKGHQVLLQKRPSKGIWGGLFSLPEIPGPLPELKAIRLFCRQKFKLTINKCELLASFKHTFSHYHLNIFPVVLAVQKMPIRTMEDESQIWYNLLEPESVGLPKPIQAILGSLI